MTEHSIGIGLEVSWTGVRLAIMCDEAVFQPLVYAELPVNYLQKSQAGFPIRADVSEWVSPLKMTLAHEGKHSQQIKANELLRKIIGSVLSKAQDCLGSNIDFVCATVAPSLAERDRSRLRSIIQEIGCEVQLLNEDQAVLNARDDLPKAESLLIYNMLLYTVEISWYRLSGDVLTLESLEVIDDCGLNVLDVRLLDALDTERRRATLSVSQFHAVLEAVGHARAAWKPGKPLKLPFNISSTFTKNDLSAEQVLEVFQDTFFSSFGIARRMITHGTSAPVLVFLGKCYQMPYVISGLQQAVGGGIISVPQERVLEGAARHAWKARGMKTITCPPGVRLPEMIPFPNGRRSRHENHLERPSIDLVKLLNLPERDTSELNWVRGIKDFLDQIIHVMESLDPEQIQSLIPQINLAFEEFLAKALDQAARKLSDGHEFDKAYKIYEKNWKKKSGFEFLAGPAIGLCLAQARYALKQGKRPEVRRWSKRGLQFDSKHGELLYLKKMGKPRR